MEMKMDANGSVYTTQHSKYDNISCSRKMHYTNLPSLTLSLSQLITQNIPISKTTHKL